MKPTLQVRLSQHLALTPQLQQSIRLLQLSTLELHQEIGQMLDENPFLEAETEDGRDGSDMAYGLERVTAAPAGDADGDAARRERQSEAEDASSPAASGADDGAAGEGLTEGEFGTTAREDWENGTEGDDFDGIREAPSLKGAASGDDELGEGLDASTDQVTLQDHLREQLHGMRLSDEDAAAVLVLIDSLDDDGYLADPLEEITARVGLTLGLPIDAALDDEEEAQAREQLRVQLRCGLAWLKSLDPTGVGAVDLAECLALQLAQRPPCPAREVALRVATQHLELLARRDVRRLQQATGASEAMLRDAQAMILACEPKPGRRFARAEANIIVPDVIVQKAGRGWRVVLNPDVCPKLRINDVYAQAIRGQRDGSMQNLSARLQEARWFVKNILQRFDTIQRVSQAIVERQKAFFTHGEIAMKPLVLREIADELGLHESTISRVTTAKYMATPHGTFELKYFFGSGLATEAGGNASSTAVRALIKQFVANEDAAKPLSDNQLAEMLAEQGIQVARRTVAKYREALKIAPASLRKAL